MSTRRLRCSECGRRRPEEETALVPGQRSGNYRRAGARALRRVCRECTFQAVEFSRERQAEGRNTPLNRGGIEWEKAARVFGITITGLRTSPTTDAKS